MGITISGPSTQIPTNVVEVGNEITQNQLNAITASNLPSSGNPLQTQSALQTYINTFVSPVVNAKQNAPYAAWTHPFPITGNFLVMLNPSTQVWWPILPVGQIFAVDYGTVVGTTTNPFNFDFYDGLSNFVALNDGGNPPVTANQYNSWTSLGGWDNAAQSTYSNTTYSVSVPASGPSYVGDWNNYLAYAYFYDSTYNNYRYRYVYRDNSGGFYTADNDFNPPS